MQKVIPAILTASAEELKTQLTLLKGKSNWVHIDIMDKKFVENTSVNLFELGDAYQYFNLEIHLMVLNPEKYFEDCKAIGAKRVLFHYEATNNIEKVLEQGEKHGFQKGVALNPETKPKVLESVGGIYNSLLLMGVHPGFQGQEFIFATLEKTREVKKLFPQLLVGIDGGVNEENITKVFKASVDYATVGSGMWKKENPIAAFNKLKELVQ